MKRKMRGKTGWGFLWFFYLCVCVFLPSPVCAPRENWVMASPSKDLVEYLMGKVQPKTLHLYDAAWRRFLDLTKISWNELTLEEQDLTLANFLVRASRAT